MKLSRNFTLAELTKSATAEKYGIDNTVTPEQIEKLEMLVHMTIQRVRDEFGATVVTSGYRSPELNRKIGGDSRSQHLKCEAVDFYVSNVDTKEVAEWCRDNLEFDQLILEHYDSQRPWIHISYNSFHDNRNEVLTIRSDRTILRGLK